MHIQLKRALCATSALAGGLLLATSALAQSTTGSATVEELVVTGASGPRSLDGIIEQTAPKTRTTIDQEFISRQMPGQTIADSLNVVPGYNFTNNDGYGNSGGNIRLRSFDCARISFQWDGMQLNDSGNYACFTNQVGDSEIISTADVAQGTTDVDAPSASATGGSINYRTRVPSREFGGQTNLAFGGDSYLRGFFEVESGELGPWATRGFASYSYTNYDKFRGTGELEKQQFNARIYQPLRDNGDFASIAFHWNRNRNNFYRQMTLAQYQQFGIDFENDSRCIRVTPGPGAQNESSQNQFVDWNGVTGTGSCTNYYNTRINPSDTGNIRGAFKWHFRDNLIFTFDPNFQYVLANGGGFTVVSETDGRLRGANCVATGGSATSGGTCSGTTGGVDLNGDGDVADNVSLYTPNTTNTRRYGINSSLIWDINDNHRVRLAYAYDRAQHRQTGDFGFYDANLNPENVFGGKDGQGRVVPTSDGSNLRGRDRFSIAGLNMFAAEYLGKFMEDKVELRLGLRAPFFKRELNQYCYSGPVTTGASSAVLCTTQPVAQTLANGNVLLRGQGTNQYIAPYATEKKYDKVLPNVGVSYDITENHQVYVSYAEALSAPRTDNLYSVGRLPSGQIGNPTVQPETTKTVDIGYRFTSQKVVISIAGYNSQFNNRIVSSFDADLNAFIDRNIGDVKIKGVDAQAIVRPIDQLTIIGNVSYTNSEVQSNTPLSGGNFLQTKGKQLVETPEWQEFLRAEWDATEALSLALQAKWVGERWTTDVNDQKVKAYQTFDFDARLKLPWNGGDKYFLQFNVKNLTDENYIGSISSTSNAITVTGSNGLQPFLTPAATRTWQLSLHAEF